MTLPSPTDGPTLGTVGFLHTDPQTLGVWRSTAFGTEWTLRPAFWSSRDEAMAALLPGTAFSLEAFVPIGEWTLLLTNGPLGTDVGAALHHVASDHGCTGIRATAADAGPQSYAGRVLEVFGPGGKPPLLSIRSIAAANDGGRWVFETFGEPFPFERLEEYKHRRKGDRFTTELLYEYLRALGVPIDAEPDWANAYVLKHAKPLGDSFES
jgi:hypothetical protein